MIDTQAVNHIANMLEKELRKADDYLEKCPGWNKRRSVRQRNALNAACNALFRFQRA